MRISHIKWISIFRRTVKMQCRITWLCLQTSHGWGSPWWICEYVG